MRRISLFLALAVVAGACGANDGAQPASESTTTTIVAPTTTIAAATTSAAPAPDPEPQPLTSVEVVTINVLHGLPGVSGCVEYTDFCQVEDRIDILWDLIETEAGCPEIVALQEISIRQFEVVPTKLASLCEGNYELLTEDLGLFDQEMILTTLSVIDHQRVELAGAPVWSAHWAQLSADDGSTIDVFATHYASSAFNPMCDPSTPATTCSSACPAADTLGACHPYETLEFLAARASPGSLQLIVGDLNKMIDEPRIQVLIDAGFVDTHLLAGNAECNPQTGVNCTSGIGGDTDLDGLDISAQLPGSRIDFVLARPPSGCTIVVDGPDDGLDRDGDGTHTGLFADTPLAQPVNGLYWASDHTGIQADIGLDCA